MTHPDSASDRADALADQPRDVVRVAAHAGQHHRAERVLEGESAEEQPRRLGHHAPHLDRPAVRTEDGQVDPVEHLTEPGAPDHGGDVELSILQHRPSVPDAGDPAEDPLDPPGRQVLALHPDHRAAVEPDLLHLLAAHGRPAGDQVRADEQERRPEQPRAPVVQPDRQLAGVPAGQHRRGGWAPARTRCRCLSAKRRRPARDRGAAGPAGGTRWSAAGESTGRGPGRTRGCSASGRRCPWPRRRSRRGTVSAPSRSVYPSSPASRRSTRTPGADRQRRTGRRRRPGSPRPRPWSGRTSAGPGNGRPGRLSEPAGE